MIVFLPSYTTSTLIIWLPRSWLDFNDSLLYLFKSHVISTAIKKAGFSSEVIKVSNTRNSAWVLLKSTLRKGKEIPSLLPEDWGFLLWGARRHLYLWWCFVCLQSVSDVLSVPHWAQWSKPEFPAEKKNTRDQSFLLLDEWKNTWILMCPKSSSQNTEGNGQCMIQTSPWRLHKAIPSTYLPSRALIYCSQE